MYCRKKARIECLEEVFKAFFFFLLRGYSLNTLFPARCSRAQQGRPPSTFRLTKLRIYFKNPVSGVITFQAHAKENDLH